jgi:hypothetical protein
VRTVPVYRRTLVVRFNPSYICINKAPDGQAFRSNQSGIPDLCFGEITGARNEYISVAASFFEMGKIVEQ